MPGSLLLKNLTWRVWKKRSLSSSELKTRPFYSPKSTWSTTLPISLMRNFPVSLSTPLRIDTPMVVPTTRSINCSCSALCSRSWLKYPCHLLVLRGMSKDHHLARREKLNLSANLRISASWQSFVRCELTLATLSAETIIWLQPGTIWETYKASCLLSVSQWARWTRLSKCIAIELDRKERFVKNERAMLSVFFEKKRKQAELLLKKDNTKKALIFSN